MITRLRTINGQLQFQVVGSDEWKDVPVEDTPQKKKKVAEKQTTPKTTDKEK